MTTPELISDKSKSEVLNKEVKLKFLGQSESKDETNSFKLIQKMPQSQTLDVSASSSSLVSK